jgi:hypothetical protein
LGSGTQRADFIGKSDLERMECIAGIFHHFSSAQFHQAWLNAEGRIQRSKRVDGSGIRTA